jgi:hypothetical protein
MKTYASKASAVRQAKKDHGANYLEIGSIGQNPEGKWQFVVIEMPLAGGFVNCPHCKAHLSNGLSDFATQAEIAGQNAPEAAITHEFLCLTCGEEFGDLVKVAPKKEAKPKQDRSAMSGACALVWDIAGSMLAADPTTRRKDILQACVDRGIAFYTARTQYQKYREACKNDASNN